MDKVHFIDPKANLASYVYDHKWMFPNNKLLSIAQVMDVLLVHYQPSSSGSVQVKQTSKHVQSSIATLGFAIVMNYHYD